MEAEYLTSMEAEQQRPLYRNLKLDEMISTLVIKEGGYELKDWMTGGGDLNRENQTVEWNLNMEVWGWKMVEVNFL